MSLTVNGTILNSTSCVSFNGSSIATIWACDTLNNTCCKVWSTYNETDQFSMRLMSSNTGTNLSLSFDEINSLFNSGCTTACCSISNILFANGKMNTIICLSSSAAVSACENTNGTGYLIVCADSTDAAQSCPTLCGPMNCSTPGLPVHHQLPEFIQT